MDDEGTSNNGILESGATPAPIRKQIRWWLLLLSCAGTAVGTIGGPLLQRLYYTHGGNRKWLSSWLQSVGFPILIPPLFFLYLKKLSQKTVTSTHFFMEPKIVFSSCILGVLLGINNYMYSTGLSYIPVSTSSLLFSTELAFTALFAFFIVKQKFTFYSFNSVVVMTLGAAVLALHTNTDRPPGVTNAKYFLGFFLTLGGAALLGLSLPLIEFSYGFSTRPITYTVVLQFQIVMNLVATIFVGVAMIINEDFQAIPREARDYEIGEVKYYVVLVTTAIVWQFLFLGLVGIIYCSSSLFAGILNSFLLPLTEVAAVVAYNEKFTGEKGLALALCLWGFTSFFIGEYKKARKPEPTIEPTEDLSSHSNLQV
ncbi:hypothetical protein AQUCO_01000094v1 [Aquilegia coerulea]|uniref:Probable purine permease n=1 Tax=Aquilegia coerulea TaxID=218851 RepID=A0A2G5E8F3_AQUCA|nr:hypothetical protein AQUCO_01000094v1 [Aquilegia coerulea]